MTLLLAPPKPTRRTPQRAVIETARVYALFVSVVQPSEQPPDKLDRVAVRTAIRVAIARHGSQGCRDMAVAEIGEHPHTAGPRLRWALETVRATFGPA